MQHTLLKNVTTSAERRMKKLPKYAEECKLALECKLAMTAHRYLWFQYLKAFEVEKPIIELEIFVVYQISFGHLNSDDNGYSHFFTILITSKRMKTEFSRMFKLVSNVHWPNASLALNHTQPNISFNL